MKQSMFLLLIAAALSQSQPQPTFHTYRSKDNGHTWIEVGKGLPKTARIHSFLIADSVAYAGTDNGLFRSTDSGQTWTLKLPSYPVQCFTSVGPRLYAGTRNSGVFSSEDRGLTWNQVSKGLADRNVRSLASEGKVVYAGTDSAGVFRNSSLNSWTSLPEGMPQGLQVFDLAVKDGAVYAALYSNGLYRSNNRGRSWERVGQVTPLCFAAHGNSLIAGHNPGGVQVSTDGGVTWRVAKGLPGPAPIWVMGRSGSKVLVGTSPGALFLSKDSGANWQQSATGLPPGSAVVAIGAAPKYTLVGVLRDNKSQK